MSSNEPFSQSYREAVGMPSGAGWYEQAMVCHCGDGKYGRFGVCYRCQGKTWLTWYDVCRNHASDEARAARRTKPVVKTVEYDEGDHQAEVEAEAYLEEIDFGDMGDF